MTELGAFGKVSEPEERRVVHNQALQKFLSKSVMDQQWLEYCKKLRTCKNVFIPLLTDDHWMLANIEPRANRLIFSDSLNKEFASKGSRLNITMYEKFLYFFMSCGFLRVGFTILRDTHRTRKRMMKTVVSIAAFI